MSRGESQQRRRALRVRLLLPLMSVLCAAAADERVDFVVAESALTRGDLTQFERLAPGLRQYPLYPYLEFLRLTRDLARAAPDEVEQFLTDFRDTPLALRLRRAWLKRLARSGRWEDYVRTYEPDDSTERHCHYLHGLLATGRENEAFQQVEPLWLSGDSRPKACDRPFAAWRKAGLLTSDLIWRRIALAMASDETGLARYLGQWLPARDRGWAELWLSVYKDPRRVLNTERFAVPHPQRERILVQGVKRLAGKSPQGAADAWEQLHRVYPFTEDLAEQAESSVGFALVDAGDAQGLEHLERVYAGDHNLELQERRLRAALALGDWDRVADWVADMPDGQRKAEHWLYWQARARENQGEPEQALALFRQAARERSLWAFLAAERAGLPYKLTSLPTPVSPEHIERIEKSATGLRIRELRRLGRDLDERREWNHLTSDLNCSDLMAAAVIAQRRGWPTQAIFTLAKTGYWDDLELRFPVLHRDAVSAAARANGLDESWVYAVLRQESAFNDTAVSGAGARGLMQLMPGTAREMASSIGRSRPSRADLFDPELNIALGSAYLATMEHRFGGNTVLATAAYNAGPGRVDKWLPPRPIDADVWIAIIPFRETRGYVRRVLAYRVIYDDRLGRPITPLSRIMLPVSRDATSRGTAEPQSPARLATGKHKRWPDDRSSTLSGH